MALLRYFLLVTFLASASAQTAVNVVDCSSGIAACTGTGIGSTCETLTGGNMQCNCGTDYTRVGAQCAPNNRDCSTDSTICANAPFTGACGDTTADMCDCLTGYEANTAGTHCEFKPAKPVLSEAGGADLNELISGNDYTLQCLSTDTLGGLPYAYTFAQGSTAFTETALTGVTQAANGATDYTCTATYDGISTPSDATTIRVKPAKPTLTASDGTPLNELIAGSTYTLQCVSANAPASTTYTFTKNSNAVTAGGEILTDVTQASAGGSYTCTATASSVPSDPSDAVVVIVVGSGKACTAANAATECSGAEFTGTCTSNICVCATGGYERSNGGCEMPPVMPTLAVEGSQPANDLSVGGSYTLDCRSTTAGVTYEYYRGTTILSGASLTSVTASNHDGTYTCYAVTSGGVRSTVSAGLAITVGAAGRYCQNTGDCSGTGYSGTCTSNRCECGTNYQASGTMCTPTGKACTVANAATECSGAEFTATCISNICECAGVYVFSAGGCEMRPAAPTLSLEGSQPASDLSYLGSYTLTCASTTAGVTYEYYRRTTMLSGATLTSVTDMDHDGIYTCYAVSSGGVRSTVSGNLDIEVGESGLYCANNDGCTENNLYTGTCNENRCACQSGHRASGQTCSSAMKTATISMFSILLAFMVSKLL